MDLANLTLTSAIQGIRTGTFSAAEVHHDVLQQIQRTDPAVHAFLSVQNEPPTNLETLKNTPLAGVPVAVKDNFCTVDFPTTASAKLLEGFQPQYESTVTAKVREAGGVIIGKTNMDAWAHGSSTETSDFGVTKNPHSLQHLPGGSSGGSAAAVAANMCTTAIGSETAGSIRQPSAWCGVVGLKPTYGRCSRFGVVAMGSSLDSPGPMGKSVADVALLFEQIAGHDLRDGTTSQQSVPKLTSFLEMGVKGLRVGLTYVDHPSLVATAVASALDEAVKVLEAAGATVQLVPLSDSLQQNHILNPDYAIGVYTVVQRSEVSSNLARYTGVRYGKERHTFGVEARRRSLLGTFTLSKGYTEKYYVKAQQVRSLYIHNFTQLFEQYDVLISPTSPGYALPIGASINNPMFGELEDMLLEPSSIAGLPGISIPCGYDSATKLSLGLDIIAPQWREDLVVQVAAEYERQTDFNPWIRELRKGAQ